MKDSLSDERELLKENVLLPEKPANQGTKKKAPTGFSTVTTWKRELKKNLKLGTSDLPTVIESDFKDAEKLFEAKPAKVTLRKPTIFPFSKKTPDEIVLLQFDPNFKSNEVVCRQPSCKNKYPPEAKRIKGIKRDLYLCPTHQKLLIDRICLTMEKENLNFSGNEFATEPGRFEGYTALIGILEGAYHKARKLPTIRSTSRIVEEAILNVRNFLIITNAVLNPENDNLAVALPPVFHILQRILENPESAEKFLQILISALKKVVDTIFLDFGVIYTWVSLANTGTKIGIGAGGFIGAVGFALGPATGAAGVAAGAAVGGICGGFLGSGIYKLTKERIDQLNIARVRQEWMARADIPQRWMINFGGDESGALQAWVTPAL